MWPTNCDVALTTNQLGQKTRPCVSFIHRVVAALRPRDPLSGQPNGWVQVPPSAQTAKLVCAHMFSVRIVSPSVIAALQRNRSALGFHLDRLRPNWPEGGGTTTAGTASEFQLHPYLWPRSVAYESISPCSQPYPGERGCCWLLSV